MDDPNNSDLAVLLGRMESKIDAISLSLNAKIDSLADKLDYRMENVVAKIAAGDNESAARLSLLQERQHTLQNRLTDFEGSLRRAYAFIAAMALAVIGGIISITIQALAK